MSAKSNYNKVVLGVSFYLLTGVAAGGNPITLTYVNGNTSFNVGEQGSANYVACVNSRVPIGWLTFYFNSGDANYASQITTGLSTCVNISTVCTAPFVLSQGHCCCLMLDLNKNHSLNAGTYSLIAEVGTTPNSMGSVYGIRAKQVDVHVSSPPSQAVLQVITPSTLPLALSVNCTSTTGPNACTTTTNPALTGTPRTITIQNIGNSSANIVTVTSTDLPTNTSISDTCSNSSLAAGRTCAITITPGQNASTDCTRGLAPTAGTITVHASNAASVSAGVVVLSYGCIYQDGFIYSIDDTTATTGSIGGKVTQQTDNSGALSGIVWDSSNDCTTSPSNACYTTNADSESNGTNLSSPSPGGNTYLIYQMLTTTHSELATSYAAGLCTETLSGHSDWYLPAICEMGYGANAGGINCGTSDSPTLQNMQSNLFGPTQSEDIAGLTTGLTSNSYWSSTEYSQAPASDAWYQNFALSGNSYQYNGGKGYYVLGVRCSRALTH